MQPPQDVRYILQEFELQGPESERAPRQALGLAQQLLVGAGPALHPSIGLVQPSPQLRHAVLESKA
eukprot:1881486-Pyramimonas_sp.AAC.1